MAVVKKTKKDWHEHWWPAPAKLNLMLNITGQRADGYHELQTVFQLIAIYDWLNFTPTEGEVVLECATTNIPVDDNLIMRAAKLLKRRSGTTLGAHIVVKKILPMGAGLGGGSSDAATTLVVLNELWELGYSVDQLAKLGLELGADVPVFVYGQSAWAEGVGELLTPLELPEQWFVVVNSDHHCSTKEVFQHKRLTRDNSAITIRDFLNGQMKNDCLPVVLEMNKELRGLHQQFSVFSDVFLTGTGSSMFARCNTRKEAASLSKKLPDSWSKWIVKGLNESPLKTSLKQYFNRLN